MLKKIIVGVDGSAEAMDAARWAGALAQRAGAELTVLSTYAIASYSAAALDGGFAVVDDEALKQGAVSAANDAAAELADLGIEVQPVVALGDAVSVLTAQDADLIVIGSHGRGGFADRLLGAVSSAVPAHARCPVVVVPPHQSGKPFMPIERIVVGVDGSGVSDRALGSAVDMADLWGAELTTIAAVPLGTGMEAISWLPVPVDRLQVISDIRDSLDASIDRATAGRDIRVSRHALDGNPAALLTEFSTAVDLIVVGTRGRGGFAGMLLGSTSQTVLQHSTCPVMTVPSPRKDRGRGPGQRWERR